MRQLHEALLSGNEAIVRGAAEAGVRVAASYPGTPCTEILEGLAELDGVEAMWSVNEKVAFETGLGASFTGARALVAMKHVGLNVAADPLFSASYTGVEGGLVVVVGDDPTAHSSQNEQDSRHYARAAKIPLLEPANSQEAKDMLVQAFELSERFDTPVLFRLTTRVCHSKSVVRLNKLPVRPRPGRDFQGDFDKYVLLPRQALVRHAAIENRLEQLSEMAENTRLNRCGIRSEMLGVITSSVTYHYVREVFPEASVLKLGMTYPLPARLIRDFAARVDRLLVIEELDPFLEEQVRALGIEVEGKEVFPRVGELTPERIRRSFEEREPAEVESGSIDVPRRAPRICPGCQYLGIYSILSRLDVTVAGDIGCYTMGALPPYHAIDSVVCMGASIGTALGMQKALGREAERPVLAVIGDSTLLHSGVAGLMDLVYNQGKVTVLVMDNGTTAMTGLQGHPGNGKTADGRQVPRIDLEQLLKAIGIDWVRVVNAYDPVSTEQTLREALAHPHPAVVISRNPCLLNEPQPVIRQAFVDVEKCTSCGECYKLGCLAIESERLDLRSVARINWDLCVGCGLCVATCPEKAITPKYKSAAPSKRPGHVPLPVLPNARPGVLTARGCGPS